MMDPVVKEVDGSPMASNAVRSFAAQYPFPLDPFQVEALEALAREESVLVAAPTGSGKTLIGEFAVWLALQQGGKAFYTTPLKALSNQKFSDFAGIHGPASVGLLTGDNSINPEAPVVVMTTEVLRNMIYERSGLLADLRFVVLDEVHYLQDPYRGAVWEEVIIHLPLDVKIVSLSATVSNAEEFADWIQTLRGTTTAIIEERRPVQLEYHYLSDEGLLPMFVQTDGEIVPNPHVRRMEARLDRAHENTHAHRGRSGAQAAPRRGRSRHPLPHRPLRRIPRRAEVVDLLQAEGMLPAIYFIFSRKGCNAAVVQCLRESSSLTDSAERAQIRETAEARCSYLDDQDLEVLGYGPWLEALTAGVAAHHAGLIPVFKETVEELFQAGLVKVVFATETLSLGINMPARSVVIESLTKFTGERHELMTPGEFTQLTGRAGRRGIDSLGHAVVLPQRDVPFQQIAGLASTRTFPLVSSFQPSYNMATNLVRNYSRDEAEHLLNSSFAQYRADRDVVVLEGQIERNEAYLASYREKMACHLGEFGEYWALRERIQRLERSLARWQATSGRQQTRGVLSLARPGQVYVVPSGKMRGPVVVVGSERSKRGEPRLLAVTRDRRLIRLTTSDFDRAPRPVANLRLGLKEEAARPGAVDHATRRRLASELQALEVPDEAWDPEPLPEEREGADLTHIRRRMRMHPCHRCPDRERHEQWAERASRLVREIEGLRRRVRGHTETLSRKFERVLEVLQEYGYVDGFELTPKGAVLAKIYNESDLLVAESLARGWLSDLSAPELAALVSTFVFESRGPIKVEGTLPTNATRRAFERILRLSEKIKEKEEQLGLDLTRGCEAGFAEVVHRWCKGAALEDVLSEDATPGDFIRSCKQTVDLLRQLHDVSEEPSLAEALSRAVDLAHRGVVAYAGVL